MNTNTNTTNTSRIEHVKHRSKETATALLEADNMSIRTAPSSACIVELFCYDANGKAIESYRISFCAEDRARLRGKV
jgi:hypothetical protein